MSDDAENPLPCVVRNVEMQTEMSVLGGLAHTRAVVRQLEAEEQKLASEIEDRRSRIKALMKLNRFVFHCSLKNVFLFCDHFSVQSLHRQNYLEHVRSST